MSELDNFKSNLTNDKKTLFGAVAIIACTVLVSISFVYLNWISFILVLLPAIFLVYPNEKIKSNMNLAIAGLISVAISLCYTVWFLLGFTVNSFYVSIFYFVVVLTALAHIYGFFCAFLVYLPAGEQPQNVLPVNTNANAVVSNVRFCRECGTKVNGDLAFCPECGNKL